MAAPIQAGSGTVSSFTKLILKSVPDNVRSDVKTFLGTINYEYNEVAEIRKAEIWLDWARRLKYLKLSNESVPDFILPHNCSADLIDVKVFAKRGPDDEIYDKHKSVREKVARGNTFLEITRGPHKGARCVLYALKKFTGGLGDDDDKSRGDNFTWKRYFTKELSEAAFVIATRKANGEAAHLSCIEIDGQLLICAGSKNVHMLIRNRADISHYRGDRYRIASEICHSVMDVLDELPDEQRHLLLKFLAMTHFTAVFEILSPSHQHVVDLSYLPRAELRFITWTKIELEPKSPDMLCTVPPHTGIEIAKALGLTTVEYKKLPVSGLQERMRMVRQGHNYEGEVFYFLDGDGQVMGLLKKKTVWYIVCRAIREKVRNAAGAFLKNRSSFSMTKILTQVEKRLDDIQKWLGLSDEAVAQWKSLAVAFVKWVVHGLETGSRKMEDISDRFPIIWKEHLDASGLVDKIAVECEEEEEGQVAAGASGYS